MIWLNVAEGVSSELFEVEETYKHVEWFGGLELHWPHDWTEYKTELGGIVELAVLFLYCLFIFGEGLGDEIPHFGHWDTSFML